MPSDHRLLVHNGHAFPLADCPRDADRGFRQAVVDERRGRRRLAALFAYPRRRRRRCGSSPCSPGPTKANWPCLGRRGPRVSALTPDCPQAHWFEREISEQWAFGPLGHPWLKPIRFHAVARGLARRPRPKTVFARRDRLLPDGRRRGPRSGRRPGPRRHHRARPFPLPVPRRDGLPPGNLLGYQHRGVERAMLGGPGPRTIHYVETLGRRHQRRPCHGLLPRRRGPRRHPRPGPRHSSSAAWPWSWSGWPTISAISARWPATSASCPRCPIAGAFAATC